LALDVPSDTQVMTRDTQIMRHIDTQVMRHISPPRPHTEREQERVRENLLGTTRTTPAPLRPSTGATFDVGALERAGGSAEENSPTGVKMAHHSARERLCALSGGANGAREGTDRQMLKDLLAIARAQQAILEVKGEQKSGGRERIAERASVCVYLCVCKGERERVY
jgi:hypothetical protein